MTCLLFSMIISSRGWKSITELMAAATWLRAMLSAKLRSSACSASETWCLSPWLAPRISVISEDCRWISFRASASASASASARASFSVTMTRLRVSRGSSYRQPTTILTNTGLDGYHHILFAGAEVDSQLLG